MGKALNDTCKATAAQLAFWASEQGVPLDEMRARVTANCAAMTTTAARMARMVMEARTRAAPDQARPKQGCDLTRENGPVQADY